MDAIRAAQFTSVATSLWLCGFMGSASGITLPTLYNKPNSVTTPIFSVVYNKGAEIVVPTCIVSAVASSYLAYAIPSQRVMYAVAGAATLGMLPWTALTMMKVNHRVCDIALSSAEQEKVPQSEVTDLYKEWTWKNWVRSAMGMVGGVAAMWAMTEQSL